MPPVRGVAHTVSEAKMARDQARRMQRQLKEQGERWLAQARRDWRMWSDTAGWERWGRQEGEVKMMWEKAERLSQEAGNPHKNREGKWAISPEDNSLFGSSVRAYLHTLQTA